VLRVAPTGVPWSLWYFRDDDGSFEGHYVNLELVHERPADGSPRVHTRDLTLDLWVQGGDTWLKDADELVAGAAAEWYTDAQAEVMRAVADQARRDLVDPGAWPLDEGWESWRPPAAWDEPLSLPAGVVESATARPT
jgi:predicted RNA-binding protein associated with RNAse of E/G family